MNFSKYSVDVNCPRCSYLVEVVIEDVKCQRTIICHNCKAKINLIDSDGSVSNSINEIGKAFDKLNNLFKK